MDQKIIQIGNSTGVILPKILTDKLSLKPGTKVFIEQDITGDALIISKKNKNYSYTSITPKFMELLENVNKNYGDALKELANK